MFASAHAGFLLQVEEGGLSILLAGRSDSPDPIQHGLRFSFEGRRDGPRPRGEEPGPAVHHSVQGRDTSRWRRNIPSYGRIVYPDLQPGLTLSVDIHGGRLDMEAELASGYGAARLVMRVEGVVPDAIRTRGSGLTIETTAGPVLLEAPRSLAPTRDGDPARAPGRLRRLPGGRIELVMDESDANGPTILAWSTFIGGSVGEFIKDVLVDEQGRAHVVGYTLSPDFPITPGAFDSEFIISEGFLARFSPTLDQLEYSTFLGGDSSDRVVRIAPASNGDLILAGCTSSSDFPVSPDAFDTTATLGDTFVCRFTADGKSLVSSTILGDEGFQVVSVEDLAVDGLDGVVVVGQTSAIDYPTTPGAFLESPPPVIGSGLNAYVSKLMPDYTDLAFSTYLGGSSSDGAFGVVILPSGSIMIVGRTRSDDFPVVAGSFATAKNQGRDAFVTRLDPTGSHLEASTFLGGPQEDEAFKVALAADGSVIIVGETEAPGFPTTPGALDTQGGGGDDAFVARLDPMLRELLYSTYLGGFTLEDGPYEIVPGPSGEITVVGTTRSPDFPVTPGCFQPQHALPPFKDAWLARLHPSGSKLLYATFLGGTDHEMSGVSDPVGLATYPLGDAVLAGDTQSVDFPTTPGAFQEATAASLNTGFITRLAMLPTGASRYGTSTHGPKGPIAIGVDSQPVVGNTRFHVTCSNAPRRAHGLLALSLAALATPVTVAGTKAWIDPAAVVLVLPIDADKLGWAERKVPIPNDASLAGTAVHAQVFWPAAGDLPAAASNALTLTIVP